MFTGRKTKKAKRDFLRAACSESTAEFLTGRETELKNVNALLSQLNEKLHSVECLSSKLDKVDNITSNLANSRCRNEILVKRSNLDSAAKISDCDRITSTPTQYPEATLPNPLTLHEQSVDINLFTFLSECSFKKGFNFDECYFVKSHYKSGSFSHRPNSFPGILPQGLTKIVETCKCINPDFSIANYCCVIRRCRNGASGMPYLADLNRASLEDSSLVFTMALGANSKVEFLIKTGRLHPQTLSLKAGNLYSMTKESLEHWSLTVSNYIEEAYEGLPVVIITFLHFSQTHSKREKVSRFGLPGQATNTKKDILQQRNTSCMNFKRCTLLLTDSVLSIKKTMYNLSDIDDFEPEFQYTNNVVIAAGINDLSRQYHTPEQVCDILLPRLKRYSRLYPSTMFIVSTVLRAATRNPGINNYVDALNNYVCKFALDYENIRIFNSHQLMSSYRGPCYNNF